MSNDSYTGIPVVLSGPSGVGKTTILHQLLTRFQDVTHSISATTRPPRPGEKQGVDYFFMTHDDFQKGIEQGSFLEWAAVHGEYYGTPRGPLEENMRKGIDVLLVIDIQGGVEVKKLYPEAVLIFLFPPSIEELTERIRSRSTDNEASIKIRLANALGEMEYAKHYDYWVINRKIDEAVQQVRSIILADRCRNHRARQRLFNLGYELGSVTQASKS